MKRSEALDKLEELLMKLSGEGDNGCYYKDAEQVLDFIENEIKMKPPKHANFKYKHLTEQQHADRQAIREVYNQKDLESFYIEEWENE